MFIKNFIEHNGRRAIAVSGLGEYSLSDTLECGQAFRYERVAAEDGYDEYITVFSGRVVSVGQRNRGELLFFTEDEAFFESEIAPYFTLATDYAAIRDEIKSLTDSEWLRRAADCSAGIAILKQDPWESLFSFIISQNNNIPRIRKIIRKICSLYGENLAVKQNLCACPLGRYAGAPDPEKCLACGACYSFPSPKDILDNPELLQEANTGFRYRYLLCAAKSVATGETDLDAINAAASYEYTVEQLKKIVGVGEKVASCVALFGFANLEAFPIDVWMRRAIDEYFGGKLDPRSLGRHAGIAQQYIFHYVRNVEEKG